MMKKSNKKSNKKYKAKRSDDYINPLEHMCGIHAQYKQKMIKLIKNNQFTVLNLLEDCPLLYRWIFIHEQLAPDVDVVPVRDFLENEFNKVIETDITNTFNDAEIKLSTDQIDLLIAFIESCHSLISQIRSRKTYAHIFNEAIILSNLRMGLIVPQIKKFFDLKGVQEAQTLCRNRIMKDEINKQKKLGNIAYYDEGGDIKFLKGSKIENS